MKRSWTPLVKAGGTALFHGKEGGNGSSPLEGFAVPGLVEPDLRVLQ